MAIDNSDNNNIIEKRLSYIESAQKIGISQTAVIFNVNRKTVAYWLKKFEEGGSAAIHNKSRKKQKHPAGMKQEYVDKLLSLRRDHPDWNATRLKNEGQIPYTVKTIIKKIKQFDEGEELQQKKIIYKCTDYLFTIQKSAIGTQKKYIVLRIKNLSNNLCYFGYAQIYDVYAIAMFLHNCLSELGKDDRAINIFVNAKSLYKVLLGSGIIKESMQRFNCRIFKGDFSVKELALHKLRLHKSTMPIRDLYIRQIEGNGSVIGKSSIQDKVMLQFFTKFPLYLDRYEQYMQEMLQADFWLKQEREGVSAAVIENLLGDDQSGVIERYAFLLYNQLSIKYCQHEKLFDIFIGINKDAKSEEFIRLCRFLYSHDQDLKIKTKAAIQLAQFYLEQNKLKAVKGFLMPSLEWAKNIKSGFLIWEVKREIARFYHRQGLYRDSISYFAKQYKYAWRFGNKELVLTALMDLCLAEIDYGNHLTVLQKIDKAKSSDKLHLSPVIEAKLLGLEASAYIGLHRKKEAGQAINEYSKLVHDLNLKIEYLHSLSLHGKYCIEVANYQDAEKYYKEFFVRSLKMKNERYIVEAYLNLGQIYWYSKSYNRSLLNYQKAYHIAKKIDDKFKYGMALGNIALLYHTMGNYNQSLEYNKRYLRIANQLGNNSFASFAYNYMGMAYLEINELKRAKYCFLQQIKVGSNVDDQQNIAFSYNNLGMISSRLGQHKATINHFIKALDILEAMNSRYVINIYENIVSYYINMDKPQRAQEMLHEAIVKAEEFKTIEFNKRFEGLGRSIEELKAAVRRFRH